MQALLTVEMRSVFRLTPYILHQIPVSVGALPPCNNMAAA